MKVNMSKKLRKTLGDVTSPSVLALKDLFDTQGKETIRKWCLDYAEALRKIAVENKPNPAKLKWNC